MIRSWLLFANFLKMVFRMKLLILVHCAFPVIMLLGWNRFRYVPVRISSMTVGSRSTKTARGTCLPELFFRSRFYRVEFFPNLDIKVWTFMSFSSHFPFFVLVDEVTKNENRLCDFLYDFFHLQGKTSKMKMNNNKKINKLLRNIFV